MKKLLSTLMLLSLVSVNSAAFAEINAAADKSSFQPQPVIENLKNSKSEVNTVRIFEDKVVLVKGNVIKIAFAQEFTTKGLKEGDKVNFVLKDNLQTKQGTLLLPAGTQIIANTEKIEPAKSFNRNAKVLLSMGDLILPNGQKGTISAQVKSKNGMLKRSGWNIFAKISEWTVGLLGVGAGAGAAIAAGSGAVGIGCLAIGLPIGAGVGLIVGSTTPGINYHVKAGKEIPVLLTEDLDIILKESL